LPSPHTYFGPFGGSAGNVAGRTVGLHIGSGGGVGVNGTTYPADVAILIQSNSSTFYTGLSFQSTSLEPDAGTGRTHAISMAPKQCIDWWGNGLANGIVSSITSTATSNAIPQVLQFENGGVSLIGGGNTTLHITSVSSAAAYLALGSAAAGGSPTVLAAGSAATVHLTLGAKSNTGRVFLDSGSVHAFSAIGVASAVNRLEALASATGNAVQLQAIGADTNIDLQLTPKGSGVVQFGTVTTIGSEVVTGYIAGKDTAGNSIKLAVVS
jgi:hypothetical protein